MLLNGLSACSASGKETDLEEKTTTAGTGEKSTSENKAQISAQEDKLEVNKAKAVLKEFFSADSIHFKCLVTYKRYDAPPVDPKTFEVWTKGMKYRSDEYESGSIKFIITVVDNKAVLFSMKSKSHQRHYGLRKTTLITTNGMFRWQIKAYRAVTADSIYLPSTG